MNLGLTVLSFLFGVVVSAFFDLSAPGEKFLNATKAASQRNRAGYWIGMLAWDGAWIIVIYMMAPIALAYFAVAVVGVIAYFLASNLFKTQSSEGGDV